ncbi:MAG: Hint domain-containing protein [Paracoccaceae bacterium]
MAIGQAGSITTNSLTENELIRITLDEPLTDPVFALTATNAGGNGYVLRVVDTQTNSDGDVVSFDFIMEEWEYLDGPHLAVETINWLAIESGVHTLPDGRIIEAGTVDSNPGSGNTGVALNGGFSDPPVILTSVMSNNDTTTVDSDPLNITASGFNIQMQEEEAEADNHASETVGYIAIQGGGNADDGGGTASSVGGLVDESNEFSLGDDFTTGIVLAETQTITGGNPGTVIITGGDADSVDLSFQEEQSADTEVNHIPETVGIVAFENGLIMCFTDDARIHTDQGQKPIDTLEPGDRIRTADNGWQPLRWVATSHLSAAQLRERPHLSPVRISPGSLGRRMPSTALTVSPQHRVLVTGWRAQLLFGAEEVLVPAKSLVNRTTITQSTPNEGVTYYHLMFDQHEVVKSSGLWSESLHPAQLDTAFLHPRAIEELRELFPTLADAQSDFGPLARPTLSVREGVAIGL